MTRESTVDLVENIEERENNNKDAEVASGKVKKERIWTGPLFHQVSACILINLVAFLGGANNSASAIMLPQLQSNSTDLQVTIDDSSWIASVGLLGMLVGSILGASTGDFLGRRMTIILSAVLYAIGMISMAFGYSVFVICIGRFLTGLAYTTSQPFVCEISSPNIRGVFGAFFSIFFGIGITVLLLFGSLAHWRYVIGSLAAMTIPLAVGVFFLPDSPTWLKRKGHKEAFEKANKFYLGNSVHHDNTIDLDKSNCETKNEQTLKDRMKTKIGYLQDPCFYKPMILLAPLFFLYDGSGCMILSYFTVEIFEETGSPLNPYFTSVIASTVLIFGGIISSVVLLKFPKKKLYLISSILLATALSLLASYSLCVQNGILKNQLATKLNWIPLVLVMAVYLFDALGFRTIKDILVGELFPSRCSSLGTGVVILLEQVAGFLMAKAAKFLFVAIHLHGVFFLCTGVVVFCGIWAAILMPETQGLSLEEIQKRYQPKSHQKDQTEKH